MPSQTQISPQPVPLSVPSDLARYPFLEALSLDPRPTYVVDLQSLGQADRPVFWNAAFENAPELYNNTIAKVIDTSSNNDLWTSFTLNDRWRVIAANSHLSGNAPPPSSTSQNESVPKSVPALGSTSVAPHIAIARMRSHDPPSTNVSSATHAMNDLPTNHGSLSSRKKSQVSIAHSRVRGTTPFTKFFCEFDWSATELGDIDSWPQQLVELCNLMLASPIPTGVYWGEKAIVLYNEPVIGTIGDRHPDAMGRHMEDVFPEVWEGHFKPLFENILEKRQPWLQYNDRRIGYKDGRLEEVFWNVTLSPIFDDENHVVATWGILYDITTQNFWQRRIATLLRLTASMNTSDSFDAMWNAFIGGFEAGDRDVPHLLVYTALDDLTTASSPPLTSPYRLKVSLGFDSSHGLYDELDLSDGANPLSQLFKQTLAADAPMCFKREDIRLVTEFWDAFLPSDAGEVCDTIIVIPIRPTQAKDALAYLIVGVNPFVRYDQDYREFIDLARRQVSSTMASILLREEEVRRERLVAEETNAQLGLWKAEAEKHELRFTRLAEIAPLGICTYDERGSLTYANDVYRDIFHMNDGDDVTSSDWWAHLVHPDDLGNAQAMFGRLLIQREAVHFEIRVKRGPKYKATPNAEGFIWLLVSANAEATGTGPQTVIACFTDINERKRAEDNQTRRLEEMINAKRQQEAFIDMTSHEIRNPLSVVLHCSEEIISTCVSLQHKPGAETVSVDIHVLDSILDAAETVVFCTLHQKRIVDDILTLSKLESDLLPVTPDNVQPLILIEGIMRLFEREIRKSDMQMSINIHPSFHTYQLEQVLLDPNRISQIIINLISNAIKFTKTQDNRRLEILLGASADNSLPSEDWPVSYMPRQHASRQDIFAAYWGANENAHLHFAVIDTGAGMSAEEQQKIFSRFTQASPRTHVKYGGSGLGLYICRALSETHGGQIGCKSVAGRGSAFGFHVEVGRCAVQPNTVNVRSPFQPKPSSSVTGLATVNAVPETSMTTSPMAIATKASTNPTENGHIPAFHVLVVEDNVLNQKVLRRQLEKAGHTVVVAHHGQDALVQLQKTRSWTQSSLGEQPFDFILMDVEMPVMNGLVCTQRIRELEKQGSLLGHVPIIATTGNARDEHTGLALSAGMDQVVLKPYSLSVLLPIAHKLREQYGTR